MKISKILAAGIIAASMAVTSAVAASAMDFDPSALIGQNTTAATEAATPAPAATTSAADTTTPIVTAGNPTPTAGNTAAPTSSSKGAPNTGVFDIFPLAAVALVSGGVVIAAKKRKK